MEAKVTVQRMAHHQINNIIHCDLLFVNDISCAKKKKKSAQTQKV